MLKGSCTRRSASDSFLSVIEITAHKFVYMDLYHERREQVHRLQRMYGMEPRQDSRLTESYCRGQLDDKWTGDVVAQELVATDFIFRNTLYGELIEDPMRRVAVKLRHKYRLTWTQTWDIVKFYAPTALKILCLERSGLAVPCCVSTLSQ